ncbi:uncharacterized protein LOC141588775 [Silene latifolia]|uniref:uncharacterized protein LOC141588775 n=1 Tax=Silene latifolia TaxID=37657 RepID=UPI003D787048
MGKFVRCDDATKEKTRLGFARLMIDVPFGKPIPEYIKFLDVDGSVICLKVEFEWKPLLCSKCNGIGHDTSQCIKGKKEVPQKITPVAPISTPVEKPNNFDVTWSKDGKYHVANTPARNIIRFSRQEIVETGLQSI